MRATDEVVRFFSCPNSRSKKVRGSPPRARMLDAGQQHAAGAAGGA
jgi:hypothetical protein